MFLSEIHEKRILIRIPIQGSKLLFVLGVSKAIYCSSASVMLSSLHNTSLTNAVVISIKPVTCSEFEVLSNI